KRGAWNGNVLGVKNGFARAEIVLMVSPLLACPSVVGGVCIHPDTAVEIERADGPGCRYRDGGLLLIGFPDSGRLMECCRIAIRVLHAMSTGASMPPMLSITTEYPLRTLLTLATARSM